MQCTLYFFNICAFFDEAIFESTERISIKFGTGGGDGGSLN
jgi:hypothetical protein